jgi:predicted nucleic acid-binding protein
VTVPFIDTDPIIRLLTGDDPVKQAAADRLFRQVQGGHLAVAAPLTVIADAVYVLSAPHSYGLPRSEVAALLLPLVQLPGFQIPQKQVVVRALMLFGEVNVDFGDAMLIASMEAEGVRTIITHDRHFDRIPGIHRVEPGQLALEPEGPEP